MVKQLISNLLGLILSCSLLSVNYLRSYREQEIIETHTDSPEGIITIERQTDYFGVAPAYKITICTDGTVVYEGKKNVKTTGIVKSRISQQDIEKIIKKVEDINYFGLKDKYENTTDGCPFYLEDSSYVYTSIRLQDKKKAIAHYQGCVDDSQGYAIFPQKLYQLEELIDVTVNSHQWVK